MKHFLRTYLPVVAAGILLSWAFPRFHFHVLAWVALAPLFLSAAQSSPLGAAAKFYLCAHIFHSILLQWLVANIFWAGGWAIVGQQLLCVALSLYWAVFGFGWRWAHQRAPAYAGAVCLAGLWVLMELLQARLFSGFGWGALGYTQGGNLYVAQWASIGGVTLISFLLLLVNALLALAWVEQAYRVRRLVAAGCIVLVMHGGGYLMLGEADYESEPFTVGIVQPNFSQEMKWDPAYEVDMVQRTAQLSRALAAREPIDLMVWPEALVVRHYGIEPFLDILTHTARDMRTHLLTGTVRDDYNTGKSFNSTVLIGPEGTDMGHYDKIHLAPFGEYIPFEEYLPFIGHIAFGGMAAGKTPQVYSVGTRSPAPLICFEVLFAPLSERLLDMGADMLVVVTNLAWFGGSNAIPQELEIARMRAIETRLPLIHSANTGISGVFDPYGRFQVVRHTVAPRGDLVDWGDRAQPHHAIMRRFVGSFEIAAPALRILPYGPVLLPWLLATVGVLLVVAAFVRGFLWETVLGQGTPKPKPKAKKKSTAPSKGKSATGPAKKKPRKKKSAAADKQDEASGEKEAKNTKASKEEE